MITYNELKEKTNRVLLNGSLMTDNRGSFPINESLYEQGQWNEEGTEFCLGSDRYRFYRNIEIDEDSSVKFRDLSSLEGWIDIKSLNAVLAALDQVDEIIVGTPDGLLLAELNKEYPYTLNELVDDPDDIGEASVSCNLFFAEFKTREEFDEEDKEITVQAGVDIYAFLLKSTACFGYSKGINYVDEGFSCAATVVWGKDCCPEDAETYFCPVKAITQHD